MENKPVFHGMPANQIDVFAYRVESCEHFGPTKWLAQLPTLADDQRTAYIVSWVIERVAADVLSKDNESRQVRWECLGISTQSANVGPRRAIAGMKGAIGTGTITPETLREKMETETLTAMIASIAKSASSYASGLRCWGAFCDMLHIVPHFP